MVCLERSTLVDIVVRGATYTVLQKVSITSNLLPFRAYFFYLSGVVPTFWSTGIHVAPP